MKEVVGDRDLAVRVSDGEVRVGADGDRAFAGVEPVHLDGVGRGERDELAKIDPRLVHARRK